MFNLQLENHKIEVDDSMYETLCDLMLKEKQPSSVDRIFRIFELQVNFIESSHKLHYLSRDLL